MTTDVLDLVIVITGASAGIGAVLAEQVAARGAAVVLAARRIEALASVAARCGGPTLVVPTDVTIRADVERLVERTLSRFGRLDVWVNNAGQGITRMPSALTDEDVDEMVRINVKSALYGMQAVLPHFKARGEGHIVNVSSMLGRMPLATSRSAYCGAKHFLNALTATFRAELRQTYPGIHVSLVSPGIVRTDFGLAARHGGPDSRDLPDSQGADEVARVIGDVIASKRADVYTRAGSQDMVVDYYRAIAEDP